MIGKKGDKLDETCGYYGERLVLLAQQLGLNTCWVAMSYSKIKTAFVVDKEEKLCIVIALGYGETQGIPHKSKFLEEAAKSDVPMPDWFKNGVKAAVLAPTAIIAKYRFEVGAAGEPFKWVS